MKNAQINYPVKVKLWIPDKLPNFKYGCPVRTKILRRAMKYVYYSVAHMPGDFIVEEVWHTSTGNEVWGVGS